MNMSGQDYAPVILRKNGPSGGSKQTAGSLNAAMRAGNVESVKKFSAGGNTQNSAQKNLSKLDNETEELSHEKVSGDLKRAIIQGRTAKKMTQAQLAQQINEKPQIVQEYEQGKAIPNNQVLGKMERVLGVKLRGKK